MLALIASFLDLRMKGGVREEGKAAVIAAIRNESIHIEQQKSLNSANSNNNNGKNKKRTIVMIGL